MTNKYNFKFSYDGKKYNLTASLKDGKLTNAKCNDNVVLSEPDEIDSWMLSFYESGFVFDMVFTNDEFCHICAWAEEDALYDTILSFDVQFTIK